MARKPNIFKGLTANDILNIDPAKFNKLNRSELRQAVERLASVGNKRLKSFENGSASPAVNYIRAHGGKFSTRNKNINELRAEFIRAKGFLEKPTSTKGGWKKVRTETISKLQAKGVNINESNFDTFWKVYERLKEVSPYVGVFKYQAFQAVQKTTKDGDIDSAVSRAQAELDKIYEESVKEQNEFEISDFFEF